MENCVCDPYFLAENYQFQLWIFIQSMCNCAGKPYRVSPAQRARP